ncbi:MAG: GAF domain-containing sensor histidine kinase, partial [Candidatus Poribacteria bacterium]|nr:GAF domain-containing sensor histidine kinase [Candidatus Poribacteria bacterium]
ILDLEILVYTLLRQVTEAMHISRGVVMQRTSSDESQFLPEASVGMDLLPAGTHLRLSQPLVDLLKSAKKPLDFTNIPFDEDSVEILNEKTTDDSPSDDLFALLRSAVWIPFVTRTKDQENLVGLLVLGEKLSEEPYTQSDLDLLGILAHQGATAVENAILYAQLNARTEAMEQARQQLMATYLHTYGGTMPANGQSEAWFGKEMGKDLVSDFNSISDALKDSHDQLMQLDRLKTQFLDNVSHELRTPLTHIKGFVDNMLDGVGGGISEKQKDYLLRVEENCDRLIRLINDLLDLSRAESGKMTLQLEPHRLFPILEEAVDGMRAPATQKEICIRLDCPQDVFAFVDTDKMKQILTNLLDNAVKYTGQGGHIQVGVTVLSQKEIQVCIEDTGAGIPDADVNLIFDRFHRASDSKGGAVGGIGLGLPIVKNLVELHGGRIWAESEIDKGSRFYLTIKRDT